jgi:hypothetical protein
MAHQAHHFLGWRDATNMVHPTHKEEWTQAQRDAYDRGYDSI